MAEWLEIPGFKTYEVSDEGDVRRRRKEGLRSKGRAWAVRKNLKPHLNRQGYRIFGLYDGQRQVTLRAARLVLTAFVGFAPTPEHQAAHNDGCRTNDRLENLRWATPKENQADRWIHGTRAWGINATNSKLTDAAVADIRDRYSRGEKSTYELAAIHGVTRATIAKLLCGKTYRDKAIGVVRAAA